MASSSSPVIVVIRMKGCPPCGRLTEKWPAIKEAIKQKASYYRFYEIEIGGGIKIDFNRIPKGLSKFFMSFPVIMVIPGDIWDQSFQSLGEDNPVDFTSQARIYRGKYVGGQITRGPDYIEPNVEEILKFLNISGSSSSASASSKPKPIIEIDSSISSGVVIGRRPSEITSSVRRVGTPSRPKY